MKINLVGLKNLFKKRMHPYYCRYQLNELESNINAMQDDAKALKIISNALLYCERLPEHKTGYINKNDARIASQFLTKIVLNNIKEQQNITKQLERMQKN